MRSREEFTRILDDLINSILYAKAHFATTTKSKIEDVLSILEISNISDHYEQLLARDKSHGRRNFGQFLARYADTETVNRYIDVIVDAASRNLLGSDSLRNLFHNSNSNSQSFLTELVKNNPDSFIYLIESLHRLEKQYGVNTSLALTGNGNEQDNSTKQIKALIEENIEARLKLIQYLVTLRMTYGENAKRLKKHVHDDNLNDAINDKFKAEKRLGIADEIEKAISIEMQPIRYNLNMLDAELPKPPKKLSKIATLKQPTDYLTMFDRSYHHADYPDVQYGIFGCIITRDTNQTKEKRANHLARYLNNLAQIAQTHPLAAEKVAKYLNKVIRIPFSSYVKCQTGLIYALSGKHDHIDQKDEALDKAKAVILMSLYNQLIKSNRLDLLFELFSRKLREDNGTEYTALQMLGRWGSTRVNNTIIQILINCLPKHIDKVKELLTALPKDSKLNYGTILARYQDDMKPFASYMILVNNLKLLSDNNLDLHAYLPSNKNAFKHKDFKERLANDRLFPAENQLLVEANRKNSVVGHIMHIQRGIKPCEPKKGVLGLITRYANPVNLSHHQGKKNVSLYEQSRKCTDNQLVKLIKRRIKNDPSTIQNLHEQVNECRNESLIFRLAQIGYGKSLHLVLLAGLDPNIAIKRNKQELIDYVEKHSDEVRHRMLEFIHIYAKYHAGDTVEILPIEIAYIMGHKEIGDELQPHTKSAFINTLNPPVTLPAASAPPLSILEQQPVVMGLYPDAPPSYEEACKQKALEKQRMREADEEANRLANESINAIRPQLLEHVGNKSHAEILKKIDQLKKDHLYPIAKTDRSLALTSPWIAAKHTKIRVLEQLYVEKLADSLKKQREEKQHSEKECVEKPDKVDMQAEEQLTKQDEKKEHRCDIDEDTLDKLEKLPHPPTHAVLQKHGVFKREERADSHRKTSVKENSNKKAIAI